MEKVVNLYKKVGETPLQRIERFRLENPEYKDVKMSYIGRLDPMADGVLICTIGDENKNRQNYLGLDKEYNLDVLWGIKTDTYDILGKVISVSDLVDLGRLNIENYKGKLMQKYPPFSSKPLNGKPLFELAKSGDLKEEEIPEKEIEIYEIRHLSDFEILKDDLLRQVLERTLLIKGDFRQEEIKESWASFFKNTLNIFLVSTFIIKASSGTYMRGLANKMGEDLGCGAIALRITRKKVGNYRIETSII
jgi:tRNA pseudouridine55 synthase